jgi:hypothetical protein
MDRKEYQRQYYQKNKEKKNERDKLSMRKKRQDPEWKKKVLKSDTISMWRTKRKVRGNLDLVYEICLNTTECYSCGRELVHNTTGSSKVCMDHNHITGYFRHAICNKCNCERGRIDKQYINVINELKFHFKPTPPVFNNILNH